MFVLVYKESVAGPMGLLKEQLERGIWQPVERDGEREGGREKDRGVSDPPCDLSPCHQLPPWERKVGVLRACGEPGGNARGAAGWGGVGWWW